MAFSEKLYTLRKQKGLSQEQLAEELNVSRQAISKWESGRAFPETEKLLAVSDYFGVSLDELMKEEANPVRKDPQEKPKPAGNERKKQTLGLIVCIGGVVCLLLWGVLSLVFPAASEQIGASSEIRLDGRGILLIVCLLAITAGAVLLLKNSEKK